MQETNEELDDKLTDLYSSWHQFAIEHAHKPTQKDFLDCDKYRIQDLFEEDNSKISY